MNFNKDTIAQLSKLDDDELTAILKQQIEIKRANGTLGDVEKTIKMISPFLTPQQRTRLTEIIQSIQNQKE